MKFVHLLSALGVEFRSVMCGLARKPGYAIAAWVMLGLAVAANAAVFAIVWGFLLKPMPYAQPDQLSVIRERVPKIGLNTPLVSVRTYLALKQDLEGVANVGLATWLDAVPVKIGGQAHLLPFERVTPSLLRTLGVNPILGRLPAADADQPGGPPEAVISYQFWQGVWGGQQDVLGKTLEVGQKAYRIVGVMPPDFFFEFGRVEAWLPFVITPERARNGNINYWMVVRREPGVSPAQLDLQLQRALGQLLTKMSPDSRALAVNRGYTLDAISLREMELQQIGIDQLPWLLQAAAALLLLLALANTINLGLVRQRARQHEFALRQVLGAGRIRLVRLVLFEHLPVVLAVGGTATLLAWAGISVLHAFGLPPALSPFQVTLAPAVVVFVWVVTVIAALIVAFGPAVIASGRRLLATIGHGPTATGGPGPRRLQRTLGVIQVSLACALIIAGGLLGMSLLRVLTQPLGFQTQHRMVATIILPHDAERTAAWAALQPQLSRLPGVTSVAVTDMLPFARLGNVKGEVRPANAPESVQRTRVNLPGVTSSFFEALNIRLLAGRIFTPTEVANQTHVTVISAGLARHLFGSVDEAIGETLDLGNSRIVGVVRDISWQPTPDADTVGSVFLPWGGNERGLLIAVIGTLGPAEPLTNVFKRSIETALPNSAIVRISTFPDLVKGASVFRAAGAGMVAAFAALALLLAALGVFAITSFIARARLGEYGIRAALGAGPLALLRLGFREAGWLLIIGLPIGLIGAYLLGRVIAGALYQTPVLDPWLYIAGAVLIAVVVFAAAWRPARKAARVPIRNLLGGGGSQ